MIQGVGIDAPDPDAEIAAQYEEAKEFLRRLAVEFVNSDLARVVIVPGNHDVHRGRAKKAMKPVEPCPLGIASEAFDAKSNVRWNWKDQKAYKVVDNVLYESRFQHFYKFRKDFYQGLDPSPLWPPDSDLFFREYRSLGLLVVGFASWYGNDCFCQGGEIDAISLASSRELLAGCEAPVAVAVWHHNVVGGPNAHDYMDQRTIHKLIDFGFRVGLHGHQHYPGAKPFELRLPNLTSMAVIGAGSLAVGDRDLPMGEKRQFNIVDINPERKSIRVYFRAMSSSGIFSASHRDDFGGQTFTEFSLPSMAPRSKVTSTKRLDEAMTAVAVGEYAQALDLVSAIGDSHAHQKRQIKIKSLQGLERREELLQLLNPARNTEEAVQAIGLLMELHRFDEAVGRLDAASSLLDHATYVELAKNIAARKAIYS